MPSLRENLKKAAIAVAWVAVPTIGALSGATAQELKDTICVQGTYSIPCAKIIWRLWQAGTAMSLQHLTGLGDSPPNSGSDLAVKGILYVIMTPPNAD